MARFGLELAGLVSDARIEGHGIPRKLELKTTASAQQFWEKPDTAPPAHRHCKLALSQQLSLVGWSVKPADKIMVAANECFSLLGKIKHDHPAGSDHPLLGQLSCELHLGNQQFKTQVNLLNTNWRHEQRLALYVNDNYRDYQRIFPHSLPVWHISTGETDKDKQHYSIHIRSHENGPGHYVPLQDGSSTATGLSNHDIRIYSGVRAARISFWYLWASGSLDPCVIEARQYFDSSVSWQSLDTRCEPIPPRRGWNKLEWVVPIDQLTTALAICFKMECDDKVGELWLDGLRVELVGQPAPSGP
jgi:hypothetical protein